MPIPATDETFKIQGYSPALSRAVAGVLDAPEVDIFKRIFDLATNWGTLRELDFVRDVTTSFNFWPARIAQICIEEGAVNSLDPLLIAILSCCDRTLKPEISGGDLPETILAESRSMSSIIEQLMLPLPALTPAQSMLAKIHLLDRARHLHLASKQRISEVLPQLLDTIQAVHGQAPTTDIISNKLSFWVNNRAPLLSQNL